METVYYNLRHMSITSQTIIDANAQGHGALANVLHALKRTEEDRGRFCVLSPYVFKTTFPLGSVLYVYFLS